MATNKKRRPGAHRGLPKGMRYADYVALEHARAKAVMEAAQSDAVRIEADTHTQRAMWLMVIAVAEAYGYGPKRLGQFFEAFQAATEWFNEKNPLTRHQIQRKMEDAGYFLDVRTIREFTEDAILAGLDIRSRAEPGEERGARRYWYAEGWI